MPAPLAIPPTVKPSPCDTDSLETVSVVMIAVAAAAPPSVDLAASAACTPDEQGVAIVEQADQPGRAHLYVDRTDAQCSRHGLGGVVCRRESLGSGVAVGAAGVDDDGDG